MDEITHEIDKVVDLLNVLKSRYFFLRAKYDVGKVLTLLYSIILVLISFTYNLSNHKYSLCVYYADLRLVTIDIY